jgi:hypothetical protein
MKKGQTFRIKGGTGKKACYKAIATIYNQLCAPPSQIIRSSPEIRQNKKSM